MKWDHKIEDLTDHNITAETVDRIKAGNTVLQLMEFTGIRLQLMEGYWLSPCAGLQELEGSLGPYPYDTLKKWVSLSNYVTEDLVSRSVHPSHSQ